MFDLLKEFKPTLLFLGKFLGIYIIGNLLYGLWIQAYDPSPDPMTIMVTRHTSFFLNVLGEETDVYYSEASAYVTILQGELDMLAVFEGCNAVNVFIVYLAFLISFKVRPVKDILLFATTGLIILYIGNLARIAGLYYITRSYPEFVYFTHKFLFTGFIYVIVFLLWMLWIKKK